MFIFNKKISFLWPRSVLSAVPPFFLCVFVTARSTPLRNPMGPVQPGLTSAAWTVPLWVDFGGVGRRGVSLASRSRNESTVLWDNPPVSFFLRPRISISSRGKTTVRLSLKHPTVWVCVCTCVPCTHLLGVCKKKIKEAKIVQHTGRQAPHTAAVIDCTTQTHTLTQTHTHLLFCPSVFSCSTNQRRPAVPQWAEPRWSQPVSVYVCIWILYFIISLQTASSLIILLTIIIRMVNVS